MNADHPLDKYPASWRLEGLFGCTIAEVLPFVVEEVLHDFSSVAVYAVELSPEGEWLPLSFNRLPILNLNGVFNWFDVGVGRSLGS